MKITIIVQARVGSTRLPQKVLLPILGEPLLLRQLERISLSKYSENIVVATTKNEEDNIICEICEKHNYDVFRGHETNLLDRHLRCGLAHKSDVVVKIPSDCPLIDPNIIDKVVDYFLDHNQQYDFVSNLHPATYPDGNDVEVIPMELLYYAWKKAEKIYELEHTTPYFWDNPKMFRIGNVAWETGLDYSLSHRFTIDYPEDYQFISTVYEELYYENTQFTLEDILALLKRKSEIYEINKMYNGVNWYRNHLNELKTINIAQTKVIYD